MQHLPTQPDQTPVSLFNPDLKEFIFYYDKVNDPTPHSIPPYDMAVFPKYMADVAATMLADHLIGKHGVKTNYEEDKKMWLDKIYLRTT